jgi:hypothetical protein
VPLSDEDVILALPEPVVPARHARSTVLLSSIAGIRETGRYDDYVNLLPVAHRPMLLSAVVGSWVPMNVAMAHYEACDALGFMVEQQLANGRSTFDKTRGIFMGTMLRMARESGVTPWNIIPYFQRFWERGYDGGGIRAIKLGPKEARIDVVQVPLLECRYYRNALRGLLHGIFELFCTKVYVTERPGTRAPGSALLRAQWV